MRRRIVSSSVLVLALAALAGLAGGEARALKPCLADCHLGQGTPLFLPKSWQIWWRRCGTSASGEPECVVERGDRQGRVLARRRDPGGVGSEAFRKAELDGHVVRT